MADDWRQGFWRNDAGALRVTFAAGNRWQNGWRLNPDNSLALTSSAVGIAQYLGFWRDVSGAIYVETMPGTAPVWRDGFLWDSDGALMTVVHLVGAERWRDGFLRSPEGALVIV